VSQLREPWGAVDALPAAGRVIRQEARPGLLRLPDEEDVGLSVEVLRTERGVRAPDRDQLAAAMELVDQLEHPLLVDDVAGDTDDIRGVVEVHFLDVLVAESHRVGRR
jgi:hypothetical protein